MGHKYWWEPINRTPTVIPLISTSLALSKWSHWHEHKGRLVNNAKNLISNGEIVIVKVNGRNKLAPHHIY